MKKFLTYIILPLLLAGTASAQEVFLPTQMDSITIGNLWHIEANGTPSVDASAFERSPEVDIAKALYGQLSGLLVKQGTGRSEENQSKLRLHGHSPLILVDGFPRELSDLTGLEIESVTVLKDAATAAIYGVKGGNGILSITTKRGKATPLHVTAKYQYGGALAMRTPTFADAYSYANLVNQARTMDGLAPRYTDNELNAFYYGTDPYAYPNVDWWKEIYRSHGDNHRAQFTFTGGNKNFRYFAALDYMKDDALYSRARTDDRYNSHVYDNRLGIRANVDVNITKSTSMKLGVMARLSEFNTPNWDTRLEKALYTLPAAAFPVKQADGVYGGSQIYGNVNPVAQLFDSGQHQYSQTKVLADLNLRQDLGMLVKGLYLDASVAFDYIGKMTEVAEKEYRYSEIAGGVQKYYGVDSKTIDFDHWFNSLQMKVEFLGRVNYARDFGTHHLDAHIGYRQRSWIENERNASSKTQEVLATVSYNWKGRLFADAVINWSGSAYLPKGDRFNWYPAINVGGIVLTEPFIKVFGSFGLSGSDDDLVHELFRQVYGSSNGHSFYFGSTPTSASGRAEGDMAALTLAPEKSTKATFGVETRFFKDRLSFNADAFLEKRSNILIDPSNVSGILGIGLKEQSIGEYRYAGADLSAAWNDKVGLWEYGFYANASWLFSKVIDDGQAFQQYEYLYHKGNPVGQCYGLEVIGFFQDQTEINNSPKQTFGTVRPGDLKYRDQNNDGVIDSQDKVRMFGSSTPRCQFGFGFNVGWNGLRVFADFQGVTGVTVSLLDSPLYQPLVGNATITQTLYNPQTGGYVMNMGGGVQEIPWTPEAASTATLPRLTTEENNNNYRDNSLWYRDGSFLKLRNVGISYTIPRKWMKICDATVSFNATNVFSVDGIKFADPEQLGAYYPATRVFWAGLKFNF